MTTLSVLVTIAFALAVYYPLALLARSDWSANSAGKTELAFSVAVAIILSLAFARVVVGWVPPDGFRTAAYAIIVGGLLVKDVTLTRIQNRRKARLAREREEINR